MSLEKIGEIFTINQEETMELIREAIEHMWKAHKKIVIGAAVVIVILIIAAL